MKGVVILDRDPNSGVLSFDLRDVLALLGEDGVRSAWTVRGVECLGGDAAFALHHASEAGEVLAGHRLAELARDVGQIVEGEFSGRLPDEDSDWITIRAVDSSAFDVQTDREDVFRSLKATFKRVDDLAG